MATRLERTPQSPLIWSWRRARDRHRDHVEPEPAERVGIGRTRLGIARQDRVRHLDSLRDVARDVLNLVCMAITTPFPVPIRAPRARQGTGTGTGFDPDIERLRKIARVLDHYLVDPIIGFALPSAGDLIGSLFGLYIVAVAIQKRMSPVLIARMLMNLAIDAAIGIIPLAGDAADVVFKANTRNVRLISEWEVTGGKPRLRDWLAIIGAVLAFCVAIGLSIYAIIALVRWIA